MASSRWDARQDAYHICCNIKQLLKKDPAELTVEQLIKELEHTKTICECIIRALDDCY